MLPGGTARGVGLRAQRIGDGQRRTGGGRELGGQRDAPPGRCLGQGAASGFDDPSGEGGTDRLGPGRAGGRGGGEAAQPRPLLERERDRGAGGGEVGGPERRAPNATRRSVRRPAGGLGRARRARACAPASAAASAGSGPSVSPPRRGERAQHARARASPSFRRCAAAVSAWNASGSAPSGSRPRASRPPPRRAGGAARAPARREPGSRTRAGPASAVGAAARSRNTTSAEASGQRRHQHLAAARPSQGLDRARSSWCAPRRRWRTRRARAQTGLGAQRSAQMRGHLGDAGAVEPRHRVEAPERLEGGVDEDQHARGVEDRHRLGHPVERRLAELELGAVARSSMDRGRDVLEQERQRPLRVRPAGDPEDLARGKLPVLLVGALARALLQLGELAPPRGEVLLLGHLPGLAQPLEEVAQATGRPASQTASIFTRSVSAGLKSPSRRFLSKTASPIGRWAKVSVRVSTKRRSEASAATRSSASSAKPSVSPPGPAALADLVPARLGVAAGRAPRPGGGCPAPRAVSGTSSSTWPKASGMRWSGRLGRRRVEAVAVGGVRPGDLAVRARGSRPAPAPGRSRRAGSPPRLGARQRGLRVPERPRLVAGGPDRKVGVAAAGQAEDLERGAVVPLAVVAEAGAVEHQRLEILLDLGAVGRQVVGERREPRPVAGQAVEQRAGRARSEALSAAPWIRKSQASASAGASALARAPRADGSRGAKPTVSASVASALTSAASSVSGACPSRSSGGPGGECEARDVHALPVRCNQADSQAFKA